ncbi:hypothetical protein [Nocardia sp. NBC_01388]|uniref:hypothetical protein n=1 Tax=Nocardia sp. NBC_01388 TaxID=2903596 RepID=UPI003244876F
MGREQVLLKAWRRPAFRSLRRSAQALFTQILTQDAPSMAGVVPLMPAKWASVCEEISEASVMADLAAMSEAHLVVVDTTTFEVLVRDYIDDSGAVRHRIHFKGALNAAVMVESELLRSVLGLELKTIGTPEALEFLEVLVPPESDSDPSEGAPESDSGEAEAAPGSGVSET